MEVSKKNEIVIKKANDHWAFLEHIEAPIWADLTLEANSGCKDVGDDWFNISHPFHQWPARHLKSKFSHPGEETLTSEVVDSQGPESPQLPSSVSRSRGKHYNTKKWGGMNLNVLLDNQQGLSKRCFQAASSLGQELKPKSKSNNSRPKGPMNTKSDARGNAKSMASCSNRMSRPSSLGNKRGESNTRSTATTESAQRQQKYMEVSSKPCDQKIRNLSDRSVGLRKSCITNKASRVQKPQKFMVSSQSCDHKSASSSAGSVNLGKSCVTKAASRVEIGSDGRQRRVRKSSSGNSSAGSSSIPGYEAKFVSKDLRQKLVDRNETVAVNLADKNKWKPGSVSHVSNTLVEGTKTSHTKGKENAAKNVTLNPECTERVVPDRTMFKNHRTKEHSCLKKGDKARSAASTKLGKDKDQCEEKNPTNLARRIYLR